MTILLDLATGLVKFATAVVLKPTADVPVRIAFATPPGEVSLLQLGLGKADASADVLAFTDDFAAESDRVWTALLDANDSRLIAYMAGKNATTVNAEVVAIIDGAKQKFPSLPVTVQPVILDGDPTSEGGPTYYTAAQTDALLAAKAAKTVATKYRIKGDGSFQLWNPDQSKWHTLSLSGAAGAELLTIGDGES